MMLKTLQLTLAVLCFFVIPAHAAIPEGNAGMLRLSFTFGHEDKAYEPWLGFSLSHRDETSAAAPFERMNDGTETAVSFNLAAPELALISNNTRTVLPLGAMPGRRLAVDCGAPDTATNNKADSLDNLMLATGGAVVIGTVVYFLMRDTTRLGVC